MFRNVRKHISGKQYLLNDYSGKKCGSKYTIGCEPEREPLEYSPRAPRSCLGELSTGQGEQILRHIQEDTHTYRIDVERQGGLGHRFWSLTEQGSNSASNFS